MSVLVNTPYKAENIKSCPGTWREPEIWLKWQQTNSIWQIPKWPKSQPCWVKSVITYKKTNTGWWSAAKWMNLCCRFLHSGCGCISYASVWAKHLKCLMHDQRQVHIMCTYRGYIYTPILKSMQRVLRYSSGHIPYDKVKTDLKVGHIGSDQKSDLFASTLYHLGWQDAKWKKKSCCS